MISEYQMNQNQVHVYYRKIGTTEIIVENIHPLFLDENEHDRVKAGIKQILFDIFSKYVEN